MAPYKSPATVEIERLGFKWYEDAQYDLSRLSKDRRIQVRETDHYAPAQQVDQYAVQMGETVFPPIIVTKNDWLSDGATRAGAREKRKEKFCHALIIDAEYGKSPDTDAKLKALGATLNQQGGARLTAKEMRSVAGTLIDMGWKNDAIGRAVGIKPSAIGAIRKEKTALARFSKVGFANTKKIGAMEQRMLGSTDVQALNDVPYKKLADLAAEAHLKPGEIKELAGAMRKTGSDADMIAHIEAERAKASERIREFSLSGNSRPPAASQLRRHLGFIIGHASSPSALVERTPAAIPEHTTKLTEAIAILTAVLGLQTAGEEVADAAE